MDECEGVDEMVEIFTKNITEALDEVTPMKSFTIRSHHKFGLSEVSKELMKQRDNCREKIKKAFIYRQSPIFSLVTKNIF